jgi:hypothetical protein
MYLLEELLELTLIFLCLDGFLPEFRGATVSGMVEL